MHMMHDILLDSATYVVAHVALDCAAGRSQGVDLRLCPFHGATHSASHANTEVYQSVLGWPSLSDCGFNCPLTITALARFDHVRVRGPHKCVAGRGLGLSASGFSFWKMAHELQCVSLVELCQKIHNPQLGKPNLPPDTAPITASAVTDSLKLVR